MQKITPFLWFDHQAEEAAEYYTGIFKNSGILAVSRFPEGDMGQPGAVMSISFELDGQPFSALNGGPYFSFTPAVSFFVNCESQAEVDYFWDKLLEGGEAQQCGWLTDRYGISWQIVPDILGRLLADADPTKAARVNQAMLGMIKLDVQKLQDAYDGNL